MPATAYRDQIYAHSATCVADCRYLISTYHKQKALSRSKGIQLFFAACGRQKIVKRGGRRAGRPLLSVPYGAVDGGEDAFEGGQVDVVGNPNAEPVFSGLVLEVDIGDRLGVGALLDGVLLVVHKGEAVHLLTVDGVEKSIDGTVAGAVDLEDGFLMPQRAGEGHVGVSVLIGKFRKGMPYQLIAT